MGFWIDAQLSETLGDDEEAVSDRLGGPVTGGENTHGQVVLRGESHRLHDIALCRGADYDIRGIASCKVEPARFVDKTVVVGGKDWAGDSMAEVINIKMSVHVLTLDPWRIPEKGSADFLERICYSVSSTAMAAL